MHLELVELLRCPVSHEDSVLVAATERVESRYITDGVLGCPVCGAEYPIVNGVAQFAAPVAGDDCAAVGMEDNHDPFMALAAQLGLSEGRSTFALIGYSIGTAIALRELVPARMLIINPPDVEHAAALLTHSIAIAPMGILVATTLPLVDDKLDGVAIDGGSELFLSRALQTLRIRGRLVAPAGVAVPPDAKELARDTAVFVAEREAKTSPPVELRRRNDTRL